MHLQPPSTQKEIHLPHLLTINNPSPTHHSTAAHQHLQGHTNLHTSQACDPPSRCMHAPSTGTFSGCRSNVPVNCSCGSSIPLTGQIYHRSTQKALLALAGDVESNPGPTSATQNNTCDSCGARIRITILHKAIHCNELGCEAITHKCCRGSNIKRFSINPVYTCRLHRGEPPLNSTAAPNAPSATARVHCLAPLCKGTIKIPSAGHTRLRCVKCGKFCHKKVECCGMKTDELNHKAESWTFFLCMANHDVDQHADLDE